MSRITIKDIAKLLGVNPSTVSRALKDHPDIGAAMKAKVQQVAKDLGYYPNYQAINFRQRKSKLIGLILPDMSMFFFPDMIKSIELITKKNGYNLIIFQSNESFDKERECALVCQNFGVDGLLVCLSRETLTLDHFDVFTQERIPVVFLDKVIRGTNNATVDIDDFMASYTAINHLAKKNYKKIAGGFGSINLTMTQQRKAGFKAALEKHQLPFYSHLCFHGNTIEEVKKQFTLLLQTERPDAIFTMTDEVLAGVIQVIHEQNLSIPEDIAVISISNGNLPYYLYPKITYIKHSGQFIGKAAADLLFDLIDTPNTVTKKQIELETYLVELDSC